MSMYFRINRTVEGFEVLLPFARQCGELAGYIVYNSLSASLVPGVLNGLLITNPEAAPFLTNAATVACENGIRHTGLARYSALTGNIADSTELIQVDSYGDLEILVNCRYGIDYWSAKQKTIACDWFYNVLESCVVDETAITTLLKGVYGDGYVSNISIPDAGVAVSEEKKKEQAEKQAEGQSFTINGKTFNLKKPTRNEGELTGGELTDLFYKACAKLTTEEVSFLAKVPFQRLVASLDTSIIAPAASGAEFVSGKNLIKLFKDGVMLHKNITDCHIRLDDFKAIVKHWEAKIGEIKATASTLAHRTAIMGKCLTTFLQASDVSEAISWLRKEYSAAFLA